MRARLVAAGCALVASGVAGCSGGSSGEGADEAPSARVFCDALAEFRDDVAAADPTDTAAYVQTLKDAAEQLEKVGTPDDIPDTARAGFELTISRIEQLPDDATADDLAKLGDVGESDQATLDDLEEYIGQTCPELSEIESPSPSSS